MCCNQAKLAFPFRRRTEFPARIAFELFIPPVGDIERRIGQHVIRAQIEMLIALKSIRRFLAEIEIHPANH